MNDAIRPQQRTVTDGALLRARALADPTRVRIHRLVGAAPTPITVYELADATGLHHTAVRQHLAKLLAAGLVVEERRSPSGPGRPRLAYRVPPTVATGGPYQVLAGLLAEAVRTGRSAREVGHAAGVAAAGVAAAGGDGDAIDQLAGEAARIGFEPAVHHRVDGTVDIVLRNCPFADVAEADPQTVCDLHLGLAEGVAERVGGIVVDGLHVADPHRGGCRVVLRRT